MEISSIIEMLPAISTASAPITALAGWWMGRRKRKMENQQLQLDGLEHLQKTVDMLVEKNCALTKEVLLLRQDNIALRSQVTELTNKLEDGIPSQIITNNNNTKRRRNGKV